MEGQSVTLNFRGFLQDGVEHPVTFRDTSVPRPTTKKCAGCQDIKSVDEFHKSKRRFDGLQSYCKGCTAKQHANWRTARPERAPSVASKLCGGCKQQKTASEFYADRKRSDGLQCQCKACTSQHHKNWRDARRRSPKAVAEQKTCRACGESKAAEEFCLDSRATDGLQSRCRQCFTQYFALWTAQRRLAKRPDVARHKVCAMCGLDKLAEDFRLAREGTSEDGLVANCKECTSGKRMRADSDSEQAAGGERAEDQPGAVEVTTAPAASRRRRAAPARARVPAPAFPAEASADGPEYPGTDDGSQGLSPGSSSFGSLPAQVLGSDGAWQQALNLHMEFL